VLDAGCGGGRNLRYLLRVGADVAGLDPSPEAIAAARRLAAALAPSLPTDRFRTETLEAHTFPDGWADVVIANAVFHFARDEPHFHSMLDGAWRAVRPGGLLFARLASTVGCENTIRPLGGGRYALPDGTERYLVTVDQLLDLTSALGGTLADPLKTTVVHAQRSMTTWVVHRLDGSGHRG
jgi:SAM-dependent methyltransferase